MLRIRKLADTSRTTRVTRYHPETGEKLLVNPATTAVEPWPLLGVQIEGDTPRECFVSTKFVRAAVAEGWATLEGERAVTRPGGPPEDRWRVTHTFVHADALVLHTLHGDVRYRITHQPDKYVASDDPTEPVTDELYAAGATRVDLMYGLELEEEGEPSDG